MRIQVRLAHLLHLRRLVLRWLLVLRQHHLVAPLIGACLCQFLLLVLLSCILLQELIISLLIVDAVVESLMDSAALSAVIFDRKKIFLALLAVHLLRVVSMRLSTRLSLLLLAAAGGLLRACLPFHLHVGVDRVLVFLPE